MSEVMEFLLIGSGPQLIASADLLRARGHQVRGVISDCPHVSAWAQQKGVARLVPGGDAAEQARWLKERRCDYLLSIVNHAITAPEVLAAPARGAINYHDSPLPAYAGFNATAWAILDGQRTHAVTWHEMTADVDGGRVLVQQRFDIGDDDTAFTLSAKCSEEGVSTFTQLLDQLERGKPEGRPQGSEGKSFHFRSDRPDVAVLDFQQAAPVLHALVRGLTFGPEDNWMSKPKLLLPGGLVTLGEARLDATRQGTPGGVLSISERGLEVAAPGGVLHFFDLAALDGAPVSGAALRSRFGVSEGQILPALPADDRALLRDFDGPVTKTERFWVKRLGQLHAPTLPGLSLAASDGASAPAVQVLTRALPATLKDAAADARHAALVGALVAYLARVGEGGSFDLALHKPLPERLATLYATAVPLHVDPRPEQAFSALRAAIAGELETQKTRRTYARDAVQRYALLRDRPRDQLRLPVAVRLDDVGQLVEGSAVTLAAGGDAGSYALVFDEAALPRAAAEALLGRIEVLLGAGLRDGDTPVSALPLLPAAERTLLVNTWQDTQVDYRADKTVHELFEEQAARTPDAVALVFRDKTLSYRELNQRANQLAHALRAAGVGRETLVGISVERSLEMVIGLLGILKAGGAYVPLDPVYPRDRLAMMLEDSKAKVLVTQRHLASRLPGHGARVLLVDDPSALPDGPEAHENLPGASTPENLAYVIFTSGSTGRPKGVMIEHRNVSNFFTGMDASLGHEQPGVWLAVTSISFDISVLELFWTLARGFEVVVQEESDKTSLARDRAVGGVTASSKPMDFGLFYFAADSGSASAGGAYRLLTEGAKFADAHGFTAVWTPERHFHAFGGLYPNPAVTTAALATITKHVHLRAGSVVLPLHNPLRVAEDWAVIDHLSGGRVGLSFASGWHVNDFAFAPENFEKRREVMLEYIDTVGKLWRGEAVPVKNGAGQTITVKALPRPLQEKPPLWIASAGSVDTFKLAGRIGANVLTNMLGQDLADLKNKFAAYREARREHGHDGDGIVSVMLHTFVNDDTERARELARGPFSNYLASSFDLVKVAPWMFPAFRQPSKSAAQDATFDPSTFNDEDMRALLDHAFDRYFDTAGLFGTPERALGMVEQLKGIGATEVACLIDFGVAPDLVLESLPHLDRLRQISNPGAASVQVAAAEPGEEMSIATQLVRRQVTHLQCTPSMARMLLSDPEARGALRGLKKLMLGGEALPTELVDELGTLVEGDIVNMYGPTETTIWSTTSKVVPGQPITIGRPIANTVIRILDAQRQLVPVGVPGELCIGGAGVVRGYLERPELTAERFVDDPCAAGGRIYRTGDLARFRADGEVEFLGRLDHQVKVNGYRIELGEIESQLTRHAAVKQAVVVARSDDGGPAKLVGYVIADKAAAGPSGDGDSERVGHWQALWDSAYKEAGEGQAVRDPRFNIAGWNDSYTGEPIPAAQMREWLDATVQRIVGLKPKNVLEIGCGTGMILYGVLPHVAHYTGVDVSPHALETIQQELTPAERAKVTLLNQPAHALEGVADRSVDLVVINSVAQYFPDHDYLAAVLKRASELVVDGGHVFVGDVRSLAHLPGFHTVIELHRAGEGASGSELARAVTRRVAEERELTLSEGFFDALTRELPRYTDVEVRLKRGDAHNEMSVFRYDVVLTVGAKPAADAALPAARRDLTALAAVREALAGEPEALLLVDLPNARLTGVTAVRDAIAKDPALKLEGLRALYEAGPGKGIEPEALYRIDDRYDVALRWAASGDASRFDAFLRHKQKGPRGRWARTQGAGPRAAHANQPAKLVAQGADLSATLRAHLREFLPEFMVPSAFVTLDAFPLTPNGKIDRKALPAPQQRQAASAAEYLPPSNDLERQIAEVWQQMLNLERVGLRDNIFDLGANSLLTVQANNRLSTLLGRKVSLVSMFRFPTVEALAAHLGDGGKAPAQAQKREQERADRRTEAAERRRQARAERSTRGS